MSRFLRDFWDFAMRERYNVLRISHWRAGTIRTADIVRAHPSQHVYSLAKVLTLTAIGLLADEGKLSVSDRALPLLSGSSVDAEAEKEGPRLSYRRCHRPGGHHSGSVSGRPRPDLVS